MGILEHLQVLETKVDKKIEFVNKLIDENVVLKEKLVASEEKVTACEKQVAELEALIQSFKEERNAIEDGILSALNRLNHFEDAVEKKLGGSGKSDHASEPVAAAPAPAVEAEPEHEPPAAVEAEAEEPLAESAVPEVEETETVELDADPDLAVTPDEKEE